MSSSSASSNVANPSQAPDLPVGEKGENPEGDAGGGHSSVNQPQSSRSPHTAFSHGSSSLIQAAGQKKDGSQEAGAQADRKASVPGFHNLDYTGHFKIKLLSRKDKHSVLKLNVEEEQFVKFCHLFHCELHLEALKQALLSDLKIALTGDGYPPSTCPQEGASDPIDISVNRVLTSLCYQLNAVNISSTSWNTDQVKDTLSLLESYENGIVIGYEVSGDVTNCWLVGERGAIKTTIEALVRLIGPLRYEQTGQQEPNEMDRSHDRAESTSGDVLYRGDILLSGGSHGSGNRQTGQTGSVNRQTGQTGSDNRQTGQTGSDNRQTGQTGSDNRQTRQTRSDNRQTGQTRSDNRQIGQTASDNRQTRQTGSDNRQTGQTGPDNRQTRQTGSDNRQTGQTGSDSRQIGQIGSDNRQPRTTDLDRHKRPSGVNEDMGQSGSESKPLKQLESNSRCQGLPKSGGRRSGQSGSSQSTTDNITGEQLAQNVMVTAQVSPDAPKDQIMDMSQRETDVYKPPFEDLPEGQGDMARGFTMATSRTEDKPRPIDHPTRAEGNQPVVNFTAMLKLDRLQTRIWSSIPLMTDYEHKFKNIKFEYKSHDHCLHITGDDETVRRVSTEILNQLERIEKDRVDLSRVMRPEQMSMLRVSGVLDYVKDHIRRKGMSCHLEQDKDTTRVYATQDDMSYTLKEIQVAIFCQEFEIDSTWRLFVDSPYVQHEMCNLQKKHNDKFAITVTESLVIIACTSDICEEVLEAINKMKAYFLEIKTKTFQYTPNGHLTVELCAKVLHDQLNNTEEKYGVKISPIRHNDKQGWKVKGPAGTVEAACEDVKKLAAAVTSKYDTPASTRQQTPSLTGRQWRSGDGPYVALYCGDGRETPDDVLVELKQGDPRSGVKFRPRDDKHISVTLNLPVWNGGENKEKYLITTQFKEIIAAAAERRVTSLSIRLDGCRDNGWDQLKAYKLFVKNTVYVLQHDNAEACSCTYFTGDQEMFKLVRDMIDRSYKGDKLLAVRDIEGVEHDSVVMSDVVLKPIIVHGEIAKMTSEVIVNTTGTNLKLDQGAVSLSILKAAGRIIQQECNQYYHRGVNHGEVAVTHGYKLKCKHVFHGALPSYKTDKMDEMKVMEQFMRNCLNEADKRKCRTISFPALGTGNLGYPRDLVAHTMFDAVKKYFQEKPDSCVESVSFVVYPKDRETVKAFEAEDKRQKEKTDEGVKVPGDTESGKNKRGYKSENDHQYPIGKPIGMAEGKRLVYNEKGKQWTPIIESASQHITREKMPATEAVSKTQETEMRNEKSTILEMTEYEEKRLIVTSNSHSPLVKRMIEKWLGKTGIQQIKVVCPFQQDTDALIILQSVNDANKLLKQSGAPYIVNPFPCQTVLNIKATVKNSIAKSIRELLKPDEIAAALHNASGVTWTVDDNGTCYIEGSLPEIHCANRYFSRIVSTQTEQR